MNDYREYVQAVARLADGKQRILNRSAAHAGVIVAAIFNISQKRVEILTGNLRDDIYGSAEVITAATSFLTKNPEAHIEIIAEEDLHAILHQNRFLRALVDNGDLSQRVWYGRCNSAQARAHTFRFIVGDGKHYRFQKEPSSPEAIVQFGRTETGRKLHEIFAALAAKVIRTPLNSLSAGIKVALAQQAGVAS